MRRVSWRVLVAIASVIGCARAEPPLRAPAPQPTPVDGRPETQSSPKYLEIEVEGQPLRMAYRDVPGQKATDVPAVVLLHGKNFSGFYWEKTMQELAKAGYRVIAPDQIGFGSSSKPDIHYSFHLLARLTAQMLDSLGVRRAFVVGHSMGGMIAARFALLYPDRVARLVLEDPIGLEDYRTIVSYTNLDDQFREELAGTYVAYLAYQKSYYVHWRPEYEAYVRDQAQWLGTGEWPRVARANALTYEMIYMQPVVYELGRLSMPTLLVVGQNDRTVVGRARVPEALRAAVGNYPELGRKAHAAIAGSKLVEIPDCGHIPHIEAPVQFMNAVLEWIRSTT